MTTNNNTENEKAIIKINNTTYNIQNDWFEIIRKYFNIDSDNETMINMLKAGLFGFNLEVYSNDVKANVYHRNVIYDEHFLNTASFPESIFNFAKMYNYSVDMATPSHCRINFAIAKNDLISNKFKEEVTEQLGTVSSKRTTYRFVINDDYIFLLGGIKFKLPYPVIITFKENLNNDDYTLTSYYDTSETNFPFLNLTSEYIKTWQDYSDGNKYVFLGLDLYQLEENTTEFTVTSENILDNLFYNVRFSDQLAYFEVYYTYNEKTELLKSYFNNTYQPDDDENFCYYSIIDDEELQISFSATSGSFRPALNSTLTVKTYTTIGSKGNFSYEGNKVNLNFANNSVFDKINVSIIPITDCSGGADSPTYTDIKNGIIEKFSTRDNLIIDNDLEKYFEVINNTETINGSSVKFMKKRNDILKRIFTGYLLARNSEGKVIPTNTAPTLHISKKYLDENLYCIPEGSSVLYDTVDDIFFLEKDTSLYNDGREYLRYSSPFLLKVNKTPLIGNYYSTYIQDEIDMNFQYVNPHIDDSFSIVKMEVTNDGKGLYTFTFDLSCTYSPTSEKDLVIRCMLTDSNSNPYGYIQFKRVDDTNNAYFRFVGYLSIDNDKLVSGQNKLIISQMYDPKGSVYDKDGELTTRYIKESVEIDSNINIEIAVLLKSSETTYKNGNFSLMSDINEYTTAIVYKNNSLIEIFKDLHNHMESDIRTPAEIKELVGEEDYIKKYGNVEYFYIKQFPLVEQEYFENANNIFYNIWNNYFNIMDAVINKLENNTHIDMKLYNTYGKSRFYYYSFDKNEDDEIIYNYLKNTHLNVNLNIHLKYYIDEDVDLAIKTYISDFLESCNKDGLFPISNLITNLETNFDVIRYIEFFKIDDENTQKLKTTFTSLLSMTSEEVEDYVPEYLNIKKKLDLSQKVYVDKNEDDDNESNVNNILTYLYNYDINITYLY